MADGVSVLEKAGFEAITTDLPGEWATDGRWTVAIQTRPVHGGPVGELCHRVLVYESDHGEVGLDTPLAAERTDTSVEAAVRGALARAGHALKNGGGR